MEETDPLAGEAQAAPAAPDQEEVGNVVRLPVATPSEPVAEDLPPKAQSQEYPVTRIASAGMNAESVAPESVAQEALPPEASKEESQTAQPDSVSPDLKDLLEMAAVQAAVDAIVDAAVRGSAAEPDDEPD
jgi:hypothetical protein